ncbi:Uncharacterised protein [Yersinia enterocolitica]|nr:Uncharacterised protein [Yersinia enterocolitica]
MIVAADAYYRKRCALAGQQPLRIDIKPGCYTIGQGKGQFLQSFNTVYQFTRRRCFQQSGQSGHIGGVEIAEIAVVDQALKQPLQPLPRLLPPLHPSGERRPLIICRGVQLAEGQAAFRFHRPGFPIGDLLNAFINVVGKVSHLNFCHDDSF